MTTTIPDGFVALADTGGPFIGVNGPLFTKRQGEKLVIGFRVEERHCNPMGMCHGGMLMTFADMLMPICANFEQDLRQFLPTVSMSGDFVGPAKLGSWVQGETDVLKVTRNLVFTQALVSADGEVVLRTNATFKRGMSAEAMNIRDRLR